jgi:hypothetical protein
MAEADRAGGWLRVPAGVGEDLEERIRARIADRFARGILTAEEVERVARARVVLFEPGDPASEAFRRCCTVWDLGRPAPVVSHRRGIGPLIVAAKRVVARMLRFQIEPLVVRQSEFNRNLLALLREILRRLGEREGR